MVGPKWEPMYLDKIVAHKKADPAFVQAREQRWAELLDAEAVILAAQDAGPRVHSGATQSAIRRTDTWISA